MSFRSEDAPNIQKSSIKHQSQPKTCSDEMYVDVNVCWADPAFNLSKKNYTKTNGNNGTAT